MNMYVHVCTHTYILQTKISLAKDLLHLAIVMQKDSFYLGTFPQGKRKLESL